MISTRTAFVAWCLFAFALLRAGVFLAHEPMLGLANNYDMIRVQGCIDAYPVRDASIPPWAHHYEAPLETYAFRDDLEPGCFLSTEALFAYAAYPLMRAAAVDDGAFSLRWLGATKALALFAMLAWAIRRFLAFGRGRAAMMTGLLAASVFADPGVMIYANAMYAEFAALFFATWLVLAVIEAVRRGRIGLLSLVIIASVTLAFTLSKVQHLVTAFLPLGVLLVLRASGAKLPRRLMVAILIGAGVGLVVQVMHLRSDSLAMMHRANVTNAILYTLLPQSDDPARTAVRLGLPAACAEHAGKNWFTPGLADSPPCPELYEMSRLRPLSLAFSEPGTLVRTWLGGVMHIRPWIPPGVGKVEGAKLAPVPAYLPSWNGFIERLPDGPYAFFVFAPACIAAIFFLSRRRMQLGPASLFVLGTTSLLPLMVTTLIVLGDGYGDPERQAQLIFTSLLVFWHFAPLLALSAWREARNNAPPPAAHADGRIR